MAACLVIDESSIVAKVAARILEGVGMATTGAASLDEATAAIAKGLGPDLVILSGALSNMPADQAVRALRAVIDRPDRRVPILVSIIETNLGLMTRAKRAGADGFIFRPFDRASLLAWTEDFRPADAA